MTELTKAVLSVADRIDVLTTVIVIISASVTLSYIIGLFKSRGR